MKKASALLAVLLLLTLALTACSGGAASSGAPASAAPSAASGSGAEGEVEQAYFDPSKLAIKALDDQTLEVKLVAPTPYFLELTAFPTYMPVNMDVLNEYGEAWAVEAASYVGNGPYRMTEWVPGSHILVEKNPEYWEVDKLGPNTIKFNLVEDDNAQYNAFQAGEMQFIHTVPVNEVASLMDSNPAFHVDPLLGTYYVSFNTQRAPFDDPLVRKAFTLAIDRDFLAMQVGSGAYIPAGGFVPDGFSDVNPPAEFRETRGDYYDPSAEAFQANLEQAKAALAEAGYADGEGFPTVTYIYNDTTLHAGVAEALQGMWAELGVNVNIEKQEWSTFLNTRKNGEYEIARDGWLGDYNDPITMLDLFITGSGNNNAQWSNPEFDQLITSIKSTGVQADRFAMMHQAEDMLMNDWIVAPIMYYGQPMMRDPALDGSCWTSKLGYYYFMYGEGFDDLSVCIGPDPDTIDPALNSAVDGATLILHMFEGLYRLDRNGVPEPAQAESYELSEDGLTYTFHLREGLKFSDGTPITAQTFVDTWIRAIDPNTASDYGYMYGCIEGYEESMIDPATVDSSSMADSSVADSSVAASLPPSSTAGSEAASSSTAA